MLRAATAFLALLCVQDPPAEPAAQDLPGAAEHDHVHSDDFSQIVEMHSQHELLEWIARHPWSLGTEVRAFLVQFDASRDLADPAEKDAWFQRGAFLAEVLVHDTLTPLLLAALFRTDEQRSQLHTVRAALDELAAALGPNSVASLKTDLDSLRPPTAPEGGWEACSLELSRVAIAARSAGARELAGDLAQEVGAFAAGARDGELALWSARFQGELAREDGDLAVAALRFGEAAEIAGALKDAGTELATLRDAVAAEEALRLRSPAAQLAKDFLGEPSKLPRRAAFAAARAGSADDAWRYAEIVRARTLVRVRGSAEGPRDVESTRKALARREADASSSTLDARTAAHAAVLEARRAVDEALVAAERESPRATILCGASAKGFVAASVQDRLDDAGLDALVGYVLGERETLALALNKQGAKAVVLPLGADEIRLAIAALLDPIEAASRGDVDPAGLVFDAVAARALCAQLVDPIASDLGPRLGVLPDGALWQLPLEMLVTKVGSTRSDPTRFLVEDRSIIYIPAAAALEFPRHESERPADHPGEAKNPSTRLTFQGEEPMLQLEAGRSNARVDIAVDGTKASALGAEFGVLPVARAMLVGGEVVIANLWQLDREAVLSFQAAFNRLASTVPRSEAHRAALLETLKGSKQRRHPFYWAAWVSFRGG